MLAVAKTFGVELGDSPMPILVVNDVLGLSLTACVAKLRVDLHFHFFAESGVGKAT